MNKPNQGNCTRIMQQLREIDFSIVETTLYLDAYPEQPQALEYYHRLVEERKKLIEAYQDSCRVFDEFRGIPGCFGLS